jgi:hypothetical protein
MRIAPWLLLATAAPLLAQAPSARAAHDTVPTLRWRLLGRTLVREAESRRKLAQQAAAQGDSAALKALPPATALDRTNLLRSLAYYQAAESARVDPARPSVRAAAAAAAAARRSDRTRDVTRAA